MDRIEKVKWNHSHGCNCSQAVVLTYDDIINVDTSTLYKLTEGLGRGCAVGGICGAVSGAILVLSSLSSDGKVGEGNTKQATYRLVEAYIEEFTELYQTCNCNELLALRAKKTVPMKTCTEVCAAAVELLEKYIEQVNS